MYFIYCIRKKQISNFKVDEISTPSDKCSVSTSIVCDSDVRVYLHNPQIPSENTAKLSQQIWVQISTNYGAISHTPFLSLVRGCFRKSDSRANKNTFHSKVAHLQKPLVVTGRATSHLLCMNGLRKLGLENFLAL